MPNAMMFRCQKCGFYYSPALGYLTPPHRVSYKVKLTNSNATCSGPCPGAGKPCCKKWVVYARN